MRTQTLEGLTILVADGEGPSIGAHSIGGVLALRSFTAFVREGNRGDGPWFAATLGELSVRLAVR